MKYAASTEIAAPPETVWAVLTDSDAYASADNGVVRVEGDIAEGQKIKVFSEVSPNRAFPVKVSLDAPTRMTWTGGMPLGLFKGVRTFTLTPMGDTTRFEMVEEFSGPMTGMMKKQMPDLQPSFDQFTAGLKAAAEAKA